MEENKMKKSTLLLSITLTTLLIVGMSPLNASADYKSGNDEFLDALNAALHNIIDDGTYDTIYSTWFSGSVVLTDDSDANTATTFPAKDDLTSDGTLDAIISAGKITFGSDTTYPPFEYIESGTVVGFDADIAAAIATEFSDAYDTTIVAEMQTNDWDPIIPDLKSGKFDAILSAMTKTEERDQEIDFTRSYYTSKQGILAGADAPTISGVADLNNASLKIAVQTGTTSDLYANENLPNADLQGYTSFDQAVAALDNGDVDFLLGDLPVLAFYAVDNPSAGYTVVGSFGDEELFGIGVRENSSDGAFLPIPVLTVFFAVLAIPTFRKMRN